MSSVERQESFGSLDPYFSDDDLLEPPTLSSKEIQHAREQALKILQTKSPEEAYKIFTEGSEVKVDNLLAEKPPKSADGKPSPTRQLQPKKN
ncbi:hypothetical protein ACP70R_011546 [Stipagrostis hirtigluma subsp. patula]